MMLQTTGLRFGRLAGGTDHFQNEFSLKYKCRKYQSPFISRTMCFKIDESGGFKSKKWTIWGKEMLPNSSSSQMALTKDRRKTLFSTKSYANDSSFEVMEERGKPTGHYNGVFLLLLLNLLVFVADHLLNLPIMRHLYLYHMRPRWYQFLTAVFCHANWGHLSGNLFFVYVFGKLVEELEGSFGVLATYILTGVGANLVSWLLLPSSMVSVGASGAVFGLFAVSVLIRLSWDWRKILEVVVLGQFVIEKVISEAQASVNMGTAIHGNVPAVNHIAHLGGALIGALLIWLLTRVPEPKDSSK